MSTDWGIGCRTCAAAGEPRDKHFTGEWDNCRDVEALQKFIMARDVIVAADDALGSLAMFSWGGWHENIASGLADFFRAHTGHDLAPMDEYGKFNDACWKQVTCGGCGAFHHCALPDGHAPPCAPRLNVNGGTRDMR
jgi:hypothetical protein